MIIVAGLIIIGFLALIAAFFLVRDNKAKTGEASQQAMPKQVANKQVVAPTEPSASAKTESAQLPDSTADKQPTTFAGPSAPTRTQESFPVPQVPFPISTVNKQTVASPRADDTSTGRTFPASAVNKQTVALADKPLGPAKTQVSFPAPQVPFPTSTVNKQTVTLAEPPSVPTQTHTPGPVSLRAARVELAEPSTSIQTRTLTKTPLLVQDAPITQTPVHEIRPIQTPAQQAESDQRQAPVAPNRQQPTNKAFPEAHMPLSIPSETVPLPPSNTVAGPLLSHSPSIDQQIAELIADTWALQQQAAEIGRRLNYLSTYIQHSPASESDGRDTDSKS